MHLFMAGCVWVYIIAIRSPLAPEPTVALTPAVAESAEHGTTAKEHKTPVKRSGPKNGPAKDAHASAAH